MSFINFIKQNKTTTFGLMAIGVVSTVVICGGYRVFIKPVQVQRRREEAEAYANFIFEQEQIKKQQREQETYSF